MSSNPPIEESLRKLEKIESAAKEDKKGGKK